NGLYASPWSPCTLESQAGPGLAHCQRQIGIVAGATEPDDPRGLYLDFALKDRPIRWRAASKKTQPTQTSLSQVLYSTRKPENTCIHTALQAQTAGFGPQTQSPCVLALPAPASQVGFMGRRAGWLPVIITTADTAHHRCFLHMSLGRLPGAGTIGRAATGRRRTSFLSTASVTTTGLITTPLLTARLVATRWTAAI